MAWLVAGASGIGKSTHLLRALSCLNQPIYAFQTRMQHEGSQWCLWGSWRPGIPARALGTEPKWEKLAQGTEDSTNGMQVHWQDFDAWSRYFSEIPDGSVVLLDELGFIETQALAFQQAILRLLERPLYLIGVIKAHPRTPFLRAVYAHPSVQVQQVTAETCSVVAWGCLRKLQPLWVESLAVSRGLNAWIGGGGKTHSILRAAQELVDLGRGRVVVATSTHMCVPTNWTWIRDREAWDDWSLHPNPSAPQQVVVGTMTPEGKLRAPDFVDWKSLKERADYVLVEADGSKRLPLKAHDPAREPVIPEETDRLFAVAGLSALGQPVGSVLHRAQTFGGFSQENPCVDERILAEVVQRHPCPDLWIWNQFDSCQQVGQARAAARIVSQSLRRPILMTSVRAAIPVYEAWENGKCIY